MNILKAIFKCNHPAKFLYVEKEPTVKPVDEWFNHVTYHLFCGKCGEKVDIKYTQITDKFWNYKG